MGTKRLEEEAGGAYTWRSVLTGWFRSAVCAAVRAVIAVGGSRRGSVPNHNRPSLVPFGCLLLACPPSQHKRICTHTRPRARTHTHAHTHTHTIGVDGANAETCVKVWVLVGGRNTEVGAAVATAALVLRWRC